MNGKSKAKVMEAKSPRSWRQMTRLQLDEFLSVCADFHTVPCVEGVNWFFVHSGDRFAFQTDVLGNTAYFLDPTFLPE